jgi:hypothetical protein
MTEPADFAAERINFHNRYVDGMPIASLSFLQIQTMKRTFFFASAALSLALLSPLKSQGQRILGIGISMNQSVLDYGMGINLTSPLIAHSFQFRLSANIQGLQGVPANTDRTRVLGYQNIRLGVIGKPKYVSDRIIIYGEGGPGVLINNSKVTSKKMNLLGYGVIGGEYLLREKLWMFLEGGGIGSGAEADKLIGKPMYATGLFFGMGLRLHASPGRPL